MTYLNGDVYSQIIKFLNPISFKNFAYVNKEVLKLIQQILIYKKKIYKLYNIPKTYKNCLYRLRTISRKCKDLDGRRCELPNSKHEFIIQIKNIRKIQHKTSPTWRINFIIIDAPWPVDMRLYRLRPHCCTQLEWVRGRFPPGGATLKEGLLEENFICFY